MVFVTENFDGLEDGTAISVNDLFDTWTQGGNVDEEVYVSNGLLL